jgi:hypothetical protein
METNIQTPIKSAIEIFTPEHIKSTGKFLQRADMKANEIDEFMTVLKGLQGLALYYQEISAKQ